MGIPTKKNVGPTINVITNANQVRMDFVVRMDSAVRMRIPETKKPSPMAITTIPIFLHRLLIFSAFLRSNKYPIYLEKFPFKECVLQVMIC